MIEFIATTGDRIAVRADTIIAVAEINGNAVITLAALPSDPIQTDWTYDALVMELSRLEVNQ